MKQNPQHAVGTDLFAEGIDPHWEQARVQRMHALENDHASRAVRQEASQQLLHGSRRVHTLMRRLPGL